MIVVVKKADEDPLTVVKKTPEQPPLQFSC